MARWIAPVLAGALLVPAAVAARVDMETPLSPTRESLTAATLADWHEDARERGGAVLVEDPALGDDIERVHAATYRLDLDGIYRFVDIQRVGETSESATDARPALFWRGALEALQAAEIPHPCQRLWFVAPEIAGEFFAAWHASGCSGRPGQRHPALRAGRAVQPTNRKGRRSLGMVLMPLDERFETIEVGKLGKLGNFQGLVASIFTAGA